MVGALPPGRERAGADLQEALFESGLPRHAANTYEGSLDDIKVEVRKLKGYIAELSFEHSAETKKQVVHLL